jgi:hypothetical protein
MTRKQSNNQVNGKMSTLLGQKKQNWQNFWKKEIAIFIYSRVYSISEQNFVNKNELHVWIFLDLINKHQKKQKGQNF